MDLDAVSDDGKDDDIQEVPATGKRKSEAGASPTKRDGPSGDTFSWSSLRGMLADQTKELQTWYRQEINGAIAQSESKVMKAVDEVKSTLSGRIADGDGRLERMESTCEAVLARLDKLEAKQTAAPSAFAGSSERGPSLVFGGWRTDTKKTLILGDLAALLKDSQVDGLLDNTPWVPAVRHSVAIVEFAQRKEENTDGVRTRMMAIIAAVNAASPV